MIEYLQFCPEGFDVVADLETTRYLEQQDWIAAIQEMAKTFTLFKSVDLIIEGCIGGNEWCAYWLKQTFPDVLYVGTDIAPGAIALNLGRVDEGVDSEQYEALQRNQEQLSGEDGKCSLVTFRANCLSPAFIGSLSEYSQSTVPMLVTFNGLLALLGQDSNPGQRKPDKDLTNAEIVAKSNLFQLQLHLYEREGFTLWDGNVDVTKRWFYLLEEVANDLQVSSFRITDGLVIVSDSNKL